MVPRQETVSSDRHGALQAGNHKNLAVPHQRIPAIDSTKDGGLRASPIQLQALCDFAVAIPECPVTAHPFPPSMKNTRFASSGPKPPLVGIAA